jgi:hypothetical protein
MGSHRRFVLQRDADVTGVSGTGIVAEGVEFSDGSVALRWTSAFPTSVVFHDRGMASVEWVHGHSGATRIVWLDDDQPAVDGFAEADGSTVHATPRNSTVTPCCGKTPFELPTTDRMADRADLVTCRG